MSAPALRSVPLQGARYQVLHDTHYRYATPVSLSRQLAHLWPRECAWQACHERALLIEPGPSRREDGHDAFSNPLSRLAFERPHEALRVSARLQVEVFAHAPAQLTASPAWETVAAGLAFSGRALSAAELEACRYRVESPYVRIQRRFAEFAADCFPPGRPLLVAAAALMEKIFREFAFDAQATQVATPLDEVLERRRGVCQDFAHLMLACLRARTGGALRQRLPADPPAARAGATDRRRRLACLGLAVLPGERLGGFRPDQRPVARPGAHHPGLGAGFFRCVAAARGDPRRR